MGKWICVARVVRCIEAQDKETAMREMREEIEYLQQESMLASELKENIECSQVNDPRNRNI